MNDRIIARALLSVSNKTGIVEFARFLSDRGIELLSTGGTARILQEHGIAVTSVDLFTGHPEILDGRVKTLHPKIHGGILAVRDNQKHLDQMYENAIKPIDLIVVNLYPFMQTIAKPDVLIDDAIENIDIGGPAMLRSSAKNHSWVTVVVDPSDYPVIIGELSRSGKISFETRKKFAVKAFRHTSQYDAAIYEYLDKVYITK